MHQGVGSLLVVLLVASCVEAPAGSAVRPELSLCRNPIESTRSALGSTETSIAAVVYKFDEPSLLPALAAAIERGVEVRLLVDGAQAGRDAGEDANSLAEAARRAGADVRFWSRARGKLHAKFTILDGRRVLAGSYNWTRSAADDNVELLLEIDDADAVKRMAALFDELWERAAASADD